MSPSHPPTILQTHPYLVHHNCNTHTSCSGPWPQRIVNTVKHVDFTPLQRITNIQRYRTVAAASSKSKYHYDPSQFLLRNYAYRYDRCNQRRKLYPSTMSVNVLDLSKNKPAFLAYFYRALGRSASGRSMNEILRNGVAVRFTQTRC